jgi:AcrR family transcriptional regulator
MPAVARRSAPARAKRSSVAHETPPARRRGQYAKARETRERILKATLDVASQVGFHRASVVRIAGRAGVAVGNLHYHFGSRAELLRELMNWLVGQLLAEVRAALSETTGAFAREEAGFRTYLAYVHRNPAYVRLAEEVRLHHPDLYERATAMWLEMFRDGIAEAVRDGELRPMDDDEIAATAHFLMGARYFLDQMIQGVDGRTYPGDDAVVGAYMKLVRSGLQNRSTGHRE